MSHDNTESPSAAEEPVPSTRPTPRQLAQLSLRILELGIVKPLDPVGSDDPREHDRYDPGDDPFQWHPNYDLAANEALKLWNASCKALENDVPAVLRPLIEHIFEPAEEWDRRYRRVCDAGWDPD